MNANDGQQLPDGPVPGERVRHGTGVNSNRAFPTSHHPEHLDPFVLFERFYIDPDQGFPMHPHRGFEIVSYMVDGGMDHEDSLGVSNVAEEGDAMRITTGSGIRHSEFPAGGRGCNGLQLWVNLPRAKKDADPDYVDATQADLPTEEHEGATVTTVVGDGSPLSLHTPMEYLDVRVSDAWEWTIPEGWTGFVYGVSGTGTVDGSEFGEGDVFTVTDETAVELRDESDLRVVAVAGQPHDEPIQQRGPFVL
ncbi:pirin family protein [Halobacterium noricense]|uniref:pirin family protein n=1 Tax=Halobacterium noricense TaxID=223182 RepID=UPI001E368B74|nr:pirin family protein [Halobacterium noricense]UHH24634.1 pirin family protein [Halobacterium noricense]